MALKHIIGNDEFQKEVINFNGIVLVDCYADWCGPCKMLIPILEELAEENESNPNIKIIKIDMDKPENSIIAENLAVSSIPALFYYKNGTIAYSSIGALPKETIQEKLTELSK